MKKEILSIKVHPIDKPITIPDGCTGVCFCFDSEKSARKYLGDTATLLNFYPKKDFNQVSAYFIDG